MPGDAKFGALCRPVDKDLNLFKRSTISAEASDMLRFFLLDPDAQDTWSVDAKSSHSLKATLLVWASRYGMDENSRTLLGHHALSGDSLACYSRDMLARPLRKLDKMLADVRTRRFIPDATRSGWLSERKLGPALQGAEAEVTEHQAAWAEAAWYDQAANNADISSDYVPSPVQDYHNSPEGFVAFNADKHVAFDTEKQHDSEALPLLESLEPGSELENAGPDECIPIPQTNAELETSNPEVLQGDEPEGDSGNISDSSSSSTSSDSSSAVNEEEFSQSQSNDLLDPSKTIVAGAILQNTKSKMLHRPSASENAATLCGIRSLANFAKLEGTRFAWPKCSRCFKGEILQTKQDVIEFLDSRLNKTSK